MVICFFVESNLNILHFDVETVSYMRIHYTNIMQYIGIFGLGK